MEGMKGGDDEEGEGGGGVQRWSDMWLRLLSFLSQCQGIDTVIHSPHLPPSTSSSSSFFSSPSTLLHPPPHPPSPSQCCRDNDCRGDAYWHNAATIQRALKHHTLRKRERERRPQREREGWRNVRRERWRLKEKEGCIEKEETDGETGRRRDTAG